MVQEVINAVLNSPLFGVCLTIGAYSVGCAVQKKIKSVLANSMLVALIIICAFLLIIKIPLEKFQSGGSVIQMFLNPATALLAVTVYRNISVLKKYFVPIIAGTAAGALLSVFLVLYLCRLFGLPAEIGDSLMTKSVTVAIATGITQMRGGIIGITVLGCMIAGLGGNMLAPFLCKLFRLRSDVAVGVSIGTSSHAVGTAKAVELGEVQGMVSSISMVLTGVITVVVCTLI